MILTPDSEGGNDTTNHSKTVHERYPQKTLCVALYSQISNCRSSSPTEPRTRGLWITVKINILAFPSPTASPQHNNSSCHDKMWGTGGIQLVQKCCTPKTLVSNKLCVCISANRVTVVINLYWKDIEQWKNACCHASDAGISEVTKTCYKPRKQLFIEQFKIPQCQKRAAYWLTPNSVFTTTNERLKKTIPPQKQHSTVWVSAWERLQAPPNLPKPCVAGWTSVSSTNHPTWSTCGQQYTLNDQADKGIVSFTSAHPQTKVSYAAADQQKRWTVPLACPKLQPSVAKISWVKMRLAFAWRTCCNGSWTALLPQSLQVSCR